MRVAASVVAEGDCSRLRADLAGVHAAVEDAQWRLSLSEECTQKRVRREVTTPDHTSSPHIHSSPSHVLFLPSPELSSASP